MDADFLPQVAAPVCVFVDITHPVPAETHSDFGVCLVSTSVLASACNILQTLLLWKL